MPSELTREFLAEVVRTSGWKLSEVESLSLEREGITSLGDSFRGVGKLVYLSLARNSISSLKGIEHLSSLVTAILLANRISSVEEIRRLASLPNLRNVDLRLNPIMSLTPLGDGFSGEASGSSGFHGSPRRRGVHCALRVDPRALVLSALPRVVNLDGREVTGSERRRLLVGEAVHRVPEAAAGERGRLSSVSRREAAGAFDGTGSARSLSAALEENCSVGSRTDEGKLGGTGGDLRSSSDALLCRQDYDYQVKEDVNIVKMREKKRDRAGADVGVSADVRGGSGKRSDGVDARTGVQVEPGRCRDDARAYEKAGSGRRPRSATRTGVPDVNDDGDGEDDHDLAALWRELDAGSLVLQRAQPMVSERHSPRDESRDRRRNGGAVWRDSRSFSQERSSPGPPPIQRRIKKQDTQLLVTELDAGSRGDPLGDATGPGRRGEHRFDTKGQLMLVDRKYGSMGPVSSRRNDDGAVGATEAFFEVEGIAVAGEEKGGDGAIDSRRVRGETRALPTNRVPSRRDPAGLGTTATTSDEVSSPKLPPPSPSKTITRETSTVASSSSDPSTSAAARALEAFRQSSQKHGLRGATGARLRAVAAWGADGDAEPYRGGKAGPRSPPKHLPGWAADVAQSVCIAADERHDLLSAAREAPATNRMLEKEALDTCDSSGTVLVTSPHAAAPLRSAISRTTTAADTATCKECGASVKERLRIDAGGDKAAETAGQGRGRDGEINVLVEEEELWRQREREFTERWNAREREFEGRWKAREREFDERRREESKEFTRSLRAMLFEAHEALISSNAWLVQRLKAVEASRPPPQTAGHDVLGVSGGGAGSGNGAPARKATARPPAAPLAEDAAGSEIFGRERNSPYGGGGGAKIAVEGKAAAVVRLAEERHQGNVVQAEETRAGAGPPRAVPASAGGAPGRHGNVQRQALNSYWATVRSDQAAVAAAAAALVPSEGPLLSTHRGQSREWTAVDPRASTVNVTPVPVEPREPPSHAKWEFFRTPGATAAAMSEPRLGCTEAVEDGATTVGISAKYTKGVSPGVSGAEYEMKAGCVGASINSSSKSVAGSGGGCESNGVVAVAEEHGRVQGAARDRGIRLSSPRFARDAAPSRRMRSAPALAAEGDRVEGIPTAAARETFATEHRLVVPSADPGKDGFVSFRGEVGTPNEANVRLLSRNSCSRNGAGEQAESDDGGLRGRNPIALPSGAAVSAREASACRERLQRKGDERDQSVGLEGSGDGVVACLEPEVTVSVLALTESG